MGMDLVGVSVRRVEEIAEALWESKGSPTYLSELNKKAYVYIKNQMFKTIYTQESKKAACEKYKAVVEKPHSLKLKEVAEKVEDGIEETLTYCDFLSEDWSHIRTSNAKVIKNR